MRLQWTAAKQLLDDHGFQRGVTVVSKITWVSLSVHW